MLGVYVCLQTLLLSTNTAVQQLCSSGHPVSAPVCFHSRYCRKPRFTASKWQKCQDAQLRSLTLREVQQVLPQPTADSVAHWRREEDGVVGGGADRSPRPVCIQSQWWAGPGFNWPSCWLTLIFTRLLRLKKVPELTCCRQILSVANVHCFNVHVQTPQSE